MRRIAGWLVALLLVAGTVQAQAVKCTSSKTTRLVTKASQFVGGTLKSWYVSSDSVATTCSGFPTARVDTVTVPGVPVHDTVWVPKPDSVKPPVDTVKPPPVDTTKPTPPAGVLWSADWASGEITSGGKFATDNNNAPILSVVPAPAGFPAAMKNALRVRVGWTGCSACAGQYAAAAWLTARGIAPMPTKVGESRAYRVYVTNDVGAYNLGWSGFHPLEGNGQDGGTDDQVWSWKYEANANGTIGFVFHTPNASYPRDNITLSNASGAKAGFLPKAIYRLEWKWTLVSGSQYALSLRVYGPDGSLLADNAKLVYYGGGVIASDGARFTLNTNTITNLRIGSNGGSNLPLSVNQAYYYGGLAVCSDWCGAY